MEALFQLLITPILYFFAWPYYIIEEDKPYRTLIIILWGLILTGIGTFAVWKLFSKPSKKDPAKKL